jgi:hypothetical protein
MIIRYVIGRPVDPKEPDILKNGSISVSSRADTSLQKYLEVCKREDKKPSDDYCDHLRQRDQIAWTYKYDMFCDDLLLNSSLYDAQHTQKQIASSSLLPPKNAFECERCRWRIHCEGDPMADHIDDWMDVVEAREPSEIRVKYGRTIKQIKRDRRGFVVSPSELRTFNKCNRKWALEYWWRMKIKEEGLSTLAMIRGSIVHTCLEILTKRTGILLMDLKTEISVMLMEMLASNEINQELFDELSKPEAIQGMASRSFDMFKLAMDDVEEVLECEQRRVLKMPGTKKWLMGIPDAVVRLKSGQIAIIEYKTTGKANLSKVADSYRTNPAVHLYAAMVRHGQLTF